jgi:hypothetical protein
MTKAKIVVAAKVVHQVEAPVADADPARVVTHLPLAGSIKHVHPRHVAHRVMRRAKKPSAPVAQRNRAERTKIWVKNALLNLEARKALVIVLLAIVRFRHARRGIMPVRESVHLSQEGIARQEADLIQPVRLAKAPAMKSAHSARAASGQRATGLAENALMVKGQENQQVFVARHEALVRRRLIPVSASPK